MSTRNQLKCAVVERKHVKRSIFSTPLYAVSTFVQYPEPDKSELQGPTFFIFYFFDGHNLPRSDIAV